MFRIQRVARRTTWCCNKVHHARKLTTQVAPAPVSETVEYPEVLDLSPKEVHRRLQEEYFNKIKNLATVEEKLIALNLPKYFGWPTFVLKENFVPYNFLPLSQFITRTVISENDRLPSCLPEDNLNLLKERVKEELEKVILFEETSVHHKHEVERLYMNEEDLPFYDEERNRDIRTRRLAKQVNSALVRVLANDHPHLSSAQLDLDPRLEAFWRVGGFYATEQDRQLRKEKEVAECMIEDPIDRFFQYIGEPILQLRSKDPLELIPKITSSTLGSEITAENSPSTESTAVEKSDEKVNISSLKTGIQYPWQEYRYSPDLYLDIPRERYHGAIVPGFWPNDPFRFGILSYHSTSHFLNRPVGYGSQEHIEASHSQAIIALYAMAYGQACYHGFTTYNDVTYPFVTQAILTNGKQFSFYQYQLNTIVLHTDRNESSNLLYNECHATPPMELYHKVDHDGVKGWNDEALLNLITVYTKARRDTAGMNLYPYLDEKCKFVSQIPEDERRQWLYNCHRHLTSHRPRHRLAPEIYDWERIFKIEHKKRVTDARKRFFEKFQDPLNDRKLNEHLAVYIPKALRKSKRIRFKDTFYPDAFPAYPEIV